VKYSINKIQLFVVFIISLLIYLPFIRHGTLLPISTDELTWIKNAFRFSHLNSISPFGFVYSLLLVPVYACYILVNLALGNFHSFNDILLQYYFNPQPLLIIGRSVTVLFHSLIAVLIYNHIIHQTQNRALSSLAVLMFLLNTNSIFSHKTNMGLEIIAALLILILFYIISNTGKTLKQRLILFSLVAGILCSQKLSFGIFIAPLFVIWFAIESGKREFFFLTLKYCSWLFVLSFLICNPVIVFNPMNFISLVKGNMEWYTGMHRSSALSGILDIGRNGLLLPVSILLMMLFFNRKNKYIILFIASAALYILILQFCFTVPGYYSLPVVPVLIVCLVLLAGQVKISKNFGKAAIIILSLITSVPLFCLTFYHALLPTKTEIISNYIKNTNNQTVITTYPFFMLMNKSNPQGLYSYLENSSMSVESKLFYPRANALRKGTPKDIYVLDLWHYKNSSQSIQQDTMLVALLNNYNPRNYLLLLSAGTSIDETLNMYQFFNFTQNRYLKELLSGKAREGIDYIMIKKDGFSVYQESNFLVMSDSDVLNRIQMELSRYHSFRPL
jgi:hypothetical protein